MSKASATRPVCAALLLAAVGLLLATPAQAGLFVYLQFADGKTNETVSASGTTFAINVYAYITGTNTIYTDDGLNSAKFALESGMVMNTSTGGTATVANTLLQSNNTSGFTSGAMDATWKGTAYQVGKLQDINGDGIQDIGSISSTADCIYARSYNTGVLYYGAGTTGGTYGTNTSYNGTTATSFLLGTYYFHVGDLLGTSSLVSGSSSITLGAITPKKEGISASSAWAQDGVTTWTNNSAGASWGGGSLTITYQSTGAALMGLTAVNPAAGNSLTIITGGSATFTAQPDNLLGTTTLSGYTGTVSATNATVTLGGTFTGGPITEGHSGSTLSAAITSSTVGTSTVTWAATAGSGTSPNNVTQYLNVLEHASPSLPNGTSTSIGYVLGGANVSVPMTLANADNPTGGMRSDLQVTGLSPGLSGTATLIGAGSSTVLTAAVLTGTATYMPGSFTASVSDNQGYSGAIARDDQTLTVNGTIGFATATSTVSFGTLLAATVNGSAGSTTHPLFSKVDNTGASSAAMGTQASLLGSTSMTGTVTMTWRQATPTEKAAHFYPFTPIVSDVVKLGGVDGTVYVLQMSYDDTVLAIAGKEDVLAQNGKINLVSDTGTGPFPWQNAVQANTDNNATGWLVELNYQGSFSDFQIAQGTNLADYIGAWGVDTTTNVVWAVLDHASDFAVVPEPATMAFLLLGGLAMTATALSRRRTAKK